MVSQLKAQPTEIFSEDNAGSVSFRNSGNISDIPWEWFIVSSNTDNKIAGLVIRKKL